MERRITKIAYIKKHCCQPDGSHSSARLRKVICGWKEGIVLENNHLHIDNPLFAEESCRHVAHRSPVVQYSLHVPVTTPADMNKYSFRTAT